MFLFSSQYVRKKKKRLSVSFSPSFLDAHAVAKSTGGVCKNVRACVRIVTPVCFRRYLYSTAERDGYSFLIRSKCSKLNSLADIRPSPERVCVPKRGRYKRVPFRCLCNGPFSLLGVNHGLIKTSKASEFRSTDG